GRGAGKGLSVRGSEPGVADAPDLPAPARDIAVHAWRPSTGRGDRFHQFRHQRGWAADRFPIRLRAGDGVRARRAHRRGGTVKHVIRRVLPMLVVAGLSLAAAAAYALQSGDIIKQGVEAYRL